MARILKLDTDEHQAVQSLLPWYVNGTLAESELALVRAHLAQCARCQADAAWQQRVRSAPPADELASGPDVDVGWARLRRALDSAGARTTVPRPSPITSWFTTRWLALAVGAQCALVLTLALVWWGVPQRDEAFRALGAAPTAVAANALVVFRPGATEAEIRQALRANRAQLVGGPTVTDAYLLRISVLSPETLSQLRSEAAVLRVESLEGDTR